MKLTELKNKIDEALRLHDDYDVVITTDDNILDIEECGVDSGRFNFNVELDASVVCEEYHIEEDDYMEHCSNCGVYHSRDGKCPSCNLRKLKKNLGVLSSGKFFL